ncbi:HPF/RaiA family ribosome-associated protein [Nocardiopsis composta]|uniref:Ribosomal subunit interface protein n=1 Tax=Nocardiopsis composta TaxID=157465 RepID=A0A7W8QIY4_9ACTN|nr:HPF/RaiA family ribosome-associated protein [Nocardiopsis composta]MBB5431150.1 ribosomal subunit interface protein [Nocardiopsis composta]
MRSRDRWEDPRISVACAKEIGRAGAAHVADRLSGLDRYAGSPILRVHATAGHRRVDGYGRLVRAEAVVDLEDGAVRAGAEADSLYAAVDKLHDLLRGRLASRRPAEDPARGRAPARRMPGSARRRRRNSLLDGPW